MKYLYNIMQNPLNAQCWHYKTGSIKQVLLSRQGQAQLAQQAAGYLPGTAERTGSQATWTLNTSLCLLISLSLICSLHSAGGQELAHATPARFHTPLLGHHDGGQDMTHFSSEAMGPG